LPSKPVSSMNSRRPPPTARSTSSAPGPSSRSANTGTTSRSARIVAGEPETSENLTVTERSRSSGRTFGLSGSSAHRAELAFLPAGQGVDEIGETVQVGHDRALGLEPALLGRGNRFAF